MHIDVSLAKGTRIINSTDGRLGEVTEPHHLARPERHEICVRYDGMDRSYGVCEDRAHIEYEGTHEYKTYHDRFHPNTGT